jgi:hypothetical protein
MTQRQQIQELIARRAQALIELAYSEGFVLTIETKPLKPLALGNYNLEINVRDSHSTYRGEPK